MKRAEILSRLRASAGEARPIIMAGVGCGLTAAGAATGGADLLATYGTAVFRRMGLPSALSFLPYHDANALAFETLPEVLAQAGDIPVLVGLGAHDPRVPLKRLVDEAERLGATGIMNEPFLGMYGAEIRGEMERAGLGFARETELIASAAGRGLLAFGWAFSPSEAEALARSGAHIVGAMLGPTQAGAAGEEPLAEATGRVDAITDAALAAEPSVMGLAHGGILAEPQTVHAFLARSRCHGYATGSSAERRPVLSAVAGAVSAFRKAKT